MHAVVITEPGEPEVLHWLEVPDPVPGPGEVVIDVAASGVNRADLMQRQGLYPPPPGAPPYPGLECAGRIRSVGDGVADWRPGDEVCALLAGGGYAEQVVVPAGTGPAAAAEDRRDRGGVLPRDGVHGLRQRLPAGCPPSR
jgi:NADPH:quinone reductase-like Zn-dependent oxidoreductase